MCSTFTVIQSNLLQATSAGSLAILLSFTVPLFVALLVSFSKVSQSYPTQELFGRKFSNTRWHRCIWHQLVFELLRNLTMMENWFVNMTLVQLTTLALLVKGAIQTLLSGSISTSRTSLLMTLGGRLKLDGLLLAISLTCLFLTKFIPLCLAQWPKQYLDMMYAFSMIPTNSVSLMCLVR